MTATDRHTADLLTRLDRVAGAAFGKALSQETDPGPLARTASDLSRVLAGPEWNRAVLNCARLPAGPLRAWFLRAAFDLPELRLGLSRAVRGLLGSEDGLRAGVELCRKAGRVVRALGPGSGGRRLLDLAAALGPSSAAKAVEIFLTAPEHLKGLSPRVKGLILGQALGLARSGAGHESAAAFLAHARTVLDQAGERGLGRWLKAAPRAGTGGSAAYLALAASRSREVLDRVAGGLALDRAAGVLNHYGRALTGLDLEFRTLAAVPDEPLLSPLAAGFVRAGTAYLPAREKGADPLAVYRARLALALATPAGPTELLLAFDNPFLAADLHLLAAEADARQALLARRPGLKTALAELDRVRRAGLKNHPAALQQLLKALARRMWGGRVRGLEDWEREAVDRAGSALLRSGPLEDRLTAAYRILTPPQARPMFQESDDKPRLKFGSIEDRRIFEADPGLSQDPGDRSGATLTRGHDRLGFMANLADLTEQLRRDEPAAEPQRAGRAAVYPEWDRELGGYRPGWVRVWEPERLEPRGPIRHPEPERGLVRRVRRSFERLRPQGFRLLRRQLDGPEIDLEAALQRRLEEHRGRTGSQRVYLDRRRARRAVALALLIDLSGSTGHEIRPGGPSFLTVQVQALWVLAEALASLGDPFGLFGFSGSSRTGVEFLTLKGFGQAWSERVRDRLRRLEPGRQNRDGAALRHAARKLLKVDSAARILFFISDGRPDDYDYSGRYALADTRMALTEARQAGIYTYALTIDRRAREYVGRMMGATPHLIMDRPERLVAFLPRLYRRLTR